MRAVGESRRRRPFAQGNLDPPGYDASNAGTYGIPARGVPGTATNPYPINNFGPCRASRAHQPLRGPSRGRAAIRPRRPPFALPRHSAGQPPRRRPSPSAIPPSRPTSRPPSWPASAPRWCKPPRVLPASNQMLDAFVIKLGAEFEKLPEDIKKETMLQWQREVVQKNLDDMINFKLLLAELKSTVPAEAVKKNEDRIRKDFNENELKKLMTQYKATSIIDLENKLREHGRSLESQRAALCRAATWRSVGCTSR